MIIYLFICSHNLTTNTNTNTNANTNANTNNKYTQLYLLLSIVSIVMYCNVLYYKILKKYC